MAQSINWPDLEKHSPLLVTLPSRARRTARLVQIEPAAHVFRKGDRPAAMYCVISGEVRLVRCSLGGAELVLQRARHGFLAEASLDQEAYHCDAVAAEATTLLTISRKAFVEELVEQPFRREWIGHLARELRRVRSQAERLSLRTARERVVHFIETEGSDGAVTLLQSKKEWAAQLGLTHEALYRTLSDMERRNDITVDGSTVRLRPH